MMLLGAQVQRKPTMSEPPATTPAETAAPPSDKMRSENLRAWFGKSQALKGVTMPIADKKVTAIIGPSGCGKSTFIRCLNRMHEVVPGAQVEGTVLLDGQPIYGPGV